MTSAVHERKGVVKILMGAVTDLTRYLYSPLEPCKLRICEVVGVGVGQGAHKRHIGKES